jgi:hypothetical protein
VVAATTGGGGGGGGEEEPEEVWLPPQAVKQIKNASAMHRRNFTLDGRLLPIDTLMAIHAAAKGAASISLGSPS